MLSFTFSMLSFSQTRMIVNKGIGLSNFAGYAKPITTLSQVPINIKDSAEAVLNKALGNLRPEAKFEHGQIIDTEAYSKIKNNNIANLNIPKYEFIFILADLSLGIKQYAIKVELTGSGKLIKLNWPKSGYTNKPALYPLDSVKTAVIKRAKKLNLNLKNYEIEFEYDADTQKLWWKFNFISSKKASTRYKSIAINWANLSEIAISEIDKVTVY